MSDLWKSCERRLRKVGVPHPFDLNEFCAQIERNRGRRLYIQPAPWLTSGAPCGMWLSTRSSDYIFFESETSRFHAEHIVLHELGHLLSGHQMGIRDGGETLSGLLPSLDPSTIKRVLGRVSYTTDQEKEAETMASMIRSLPGYSGGWRNGRDRNDLDQVSEVLNYTAFDA